MVHPRTYYFVIASTLFITSPVICIAAEDVDEHDTNPKSQQQNSPDTAEEQKRSTPYDTLLDSWKYFDPNTTTTVVPGDIEYIPIRISGQGIKYVPKSLVEEVTPLHSIPETTAQAVRTTTPLYAGPSYGYNSDHNDYGVLLRRVEKLETIVTEQTEMLNRLLEQVNLQGQAE